MTTDSLMEALQGRWRVVYSEFDGEMTPVADFSTIVIENNGSQFSVEKNGSIVHEGKFSINVSVTPHEIVYIYTRGSEVFLGGPRVGVFQLVGDTFKTNLAAVGHRSPQDFNTFPDSGTVLSIHQKVGSESGREIAALSSTTRAVSQW
ncbi:hypothetical protein [Microseira wollei]|uniref:Lipocalin-like domain-containing protein n=1 Tax=Microseira wollei NIES-4236 TaxID=2530354 RepID=A0AAV3XJV6_9CYAN|nr:hypothetical protein [Microseira wollei]GET41310.1 hypothetical protein MiSe_61220 [Microseira wollei NIES-4236]